MTANPLEAAPVGSVAIVGAGPGHPGLITRLGWEYLQSCDAVVYDDLVALDLISCLPARVERHYMGKIAGARSVPQDEINTLLVSLARRGGRVVRLKGGDPLVFGRGGEEAFALKEAGIPFVIVPGVTSASAAAAGLGVPLTDRRASSWLLLATGRSADSSSLPVPWESIGALPGGTIVIYMGVATLGRVTEQLIRGGADPNTPAVAVANAYSELQRFIKSDLKNLASTAAAAGMERPAVIIIGRTADWTDTLFWRRTGPLAAKRILVTRPAAQCEDLCRPLRALGGEPIPLPTISIEPVEDAEGWNAFLKEVSKWRWMVFTSANGVNFFFRAYLERGGDLRALANAKLAVIGPQTAQTLARWGLKADYMPDLSYSESLAAGLSSRDELAEAAVLRVKGSYTDDTLSRRLELTGARVQSLSVYSIHTARWDDHWRDLVVARPPDWVTFTSGSSVKAFWEILGAGDARRVLKAAQPAVIGKVTAEVLTEYGFTPAVVSPVQTCAALAQAIADFETRSTQQHHLSRHT